MVKLFRNFSKTQKSTFIVCFVLILLSIAAGIITRNSYARITMNDDAYHDALLSVDEEYAKGFDEEEGLAYIAEKSIQDFDEYFDYVFKAKCLDTINCSGCQKHILQVISTIRGDIDETGNNIACYKLSRFYASEDKSHMIYDPTEDVPLKAGKTYLIFANKRDYDEDYQKTLECNEYVSIGTTPTAFVLDDEQTTYIDINKDKTFATYDDKYYTCFSQEALDHINKFAKEIINHYC